MCLPLAPHKRALVFCRRRCSRKTKDWLFCMQNFSLSNIEGNTPLHWACLNGQKESARVLLQAGASATALNHYDATPVDAALSRDFQEIVDLINEFNVPSKEVEEVEVDDDAPADTDTDMALDLEPEVGATASCIGDGAQGVKP